MDMNSPGWEMMEDTTHQQWEEMLKADKAYDLWLDHMNKQSENGLTTMNDSVNQVEKMK